jgi:peptidoglycan-associated lipoprotein
VHYLPAVMTNGQEAHMNNLARRMAPVAALALGAVLSGCATVKPEELDSRLEALRAEMRQADEQNANDISRVDQRVTAVDQRVGTLERRVAALESDLAALRREFGTVVERFEASLAFVTPVHFAYDRADIRPEDREFLDRFASVMKRRYADATVTVEGFADPAGSEAYNVALGRRRADAVRTYLVETAGLSAAQVRTVSYGEATDRLVLPDAHGPGEPGLENRRVAMVIDFVPRVGAMGREPLAP